MPRRRSMDSMSPNAAPHAAACVATSPTVERPRSSLTAPPRPFRRAPRRTPREIADAKKATARTYAVHVGVDTGKSFHKLVAKGPDGRRRPPERVEANAASFRAADAYLVNTFGVQREQILVGVEFAGHNGFTFAHFLAKQGYRVVSVLPAVTKRHKEDEDGSPEKNDDKDAAQICAMLEMGLYVGFPLLDDLGAELRQLATERHRLAAEHTRLVNRLHALLDLAWPEFTAQFSSLHKRTPWAILERWPTAADLAEASPQAVHAAVKQASRGLIKGDRVRALIASARETIAVAEGTDGRRAELERVLARAAMVREHIADVEARLAVLIADMPAAQALLTVPGVGVVCAATLIAEVGDPAWYEHPKQVLKLAGLSMAGRRSGTSVRGRVRQTKRGRPLFRRQLFLLAGRWCQKRGLCRPVYEALRRNGQGKTAALCAVARKLVPLIFMVMRTGQPFDLARWTAARRRNGPAIAPTA